MDSNAEAIFWIYGLIIFYAVFIRKPKHHTTIIFDEFGNFLVKNQCSKCKDCYDREKKDVEKQQHNNIYPFNK